MKHHAPAFVWRGVGSFLHAAAADCPRYAKQVQAERTREKNTVKRASQAALKSLVKRKGRCVWLRFQSCAIMNTT